MKYMIVRTSSDIIEGTLVYICERGSASDKMEDRLCEKRLKGFVNILQSALWSKVYCL